MAVDNSKKHGIYATQYDELARSTEWHGHEALFGMVFEYVGPRQSLLDIGIGTGLSAFLFNKAGLEVYGVDYSEDMLKVCGEKKIAKELKVYDISQNDWPYGDEEFHYVTSCGVFHFLKNLDVAFVEAHRILKSGGIFCFTVKEATDNKTERVDTGSGIVVYCHGWSYISKLIKEYNFSYLKRMSLETYNDPGKKEKSVFTIYVLKKGSK